MGAACSVASRDKTIISGSSNDVLLRNVQYSPSWSFHCDNRVRVAGEDTSVNWFSNGVCRNVGMDVISGSSVEAAYAPEDGSQLNSSQTLTWQKSPISETSAETLSMAGQSSSRKPPAEVNDSAQSPALSDPSPTKLSPSVNSISSQSTSSLSSRGHLFPGSSTPSRWTRRSPGRQFSERDSRRERLSLDSRLLSSPHTNIQTCGVCSKLVTETCELNKYQLSVIAVLVCGHVYHGECLENSTPEVNRYDPVCPVCTFGEKKTLKLSEKVLKAKLDSRAKNKKSRKWIVNEDQDHDSSVFGRYGIKGIKLISSSSMKSSSGKPFLKSHFSFGSKAIKSMLENHSDATQRKGFFWSKSTKQ